MTTPRPSAAFVASTFVLSFAGCYHGPTVEGPPTIGTATEGSPLPARPDPIAGPPAPWSTMSRGERADYMRAEVVPTMRPLFRAFDTEQFADFDCVTCHGPRASLGGYDMPSPTLPLLPAPDSPAWRAMTVEREHSFTFMAERVEPAMAALLGVEPYDPETQQGFGCFDCHTQEEE